VRKLITLILLVCSLSSSFAGEAAPVAADPALEAKVQSLSEVLRCLVCQNQNLADSHADLAIDLKNQVREMLREGMTEKQVIDYMVERYGDFVLYRPPLKSTTWLLWGAPFLLLLGGLAGLFWLLKRRHAHAEEPLDELDRQAAARLLQG
jgi:cytochrome c-type biogenesis protein CcmH